MRTERRVWTGLREGPFPTVLTEGELSPGADYEWLHTNGAGAYAMSTAVLMHTRRTHGLLIAALDPPLDRYVMLSHGGVTVESEGKTYRLATHQFPGIAPTPGYRLLRKFAQDPIPRWIYQLGAHEFERGFALVRGKNAIVLAYTWRGASTARVSVRPLLPFRPIHSLMREHGAMVQRVVLRPGEVEIQPMQSLPPVTFLHRAVFVGSPDWWRRFEYTADREMGLEYLEDMWTPGTFELELRPNKPAYLLVAVGTPPTGTPGELLQEAIDHERNQDPGPERNLAVRALSVAAERYCAYACERPLVLAGYPWLDAIVRDGLVAFSGLFLARGKIEAAKQVLGTYVGTMRGGLLPFQITTRRMPTHRAPDATLWLFEAAAALVEHTGPEDEFVRRRVYSALVRAFVGLRRGRRHGVWLSDDGLLANGMNGIGLTWMDAKVGDIVITPRRGLAVEFQALWTHACDTIARLSSSYGHLALTEAASQAGLRARQAFRERFWCNETEYAFDCISEQRGTAEAWADASVRPNAVIALAVDPSLFDDWQAAAIIGRARTELLTRRGMRSLSPLEPGYRGHYEGRPEERDSSYHQGTAWTHLLGAFVRATLRLSPLDFELREELRGYVEAALDAGPVLGQVTQLADGNEPNRPRGCPAQAWSVAELLRALAVDLGL